VSNTDHRFEYPELPEGQSTSAWDFTHVPSDAVVMEFSQITGGIEFECRRTTPTPLSLDDAQKNRGKPRYGAAPGVVRRVCTTGTLGFALHVCFGADATETEKSAARAIVSSIQLLTADPR
jgi:hypothetical protein